jgi:hypothetical protein
MDVVINNESGYEEALIGIGYSYGRTDPELLKKVALKLCDKDGGHNKFLESIQVWIEINAARYWWQEFDTYRVGTTKQSESTIHTITKRPLTKDDFSYPVPQESINYINNLIYNYTNAQDSKKMWFNLIKANLPEGFLQRRMVCTNYKVLSNMIAQRKKHVLHEWHYFIEEVLAQLEHPEFLTKRYGGKEPWK